MVSAVCKQNVNQNDLEVITVKSLEKDLYTPYCDKDLQAEH